MCDNPRATKSDFYDDMADKIARYGWAIQYVEPGRVRPAWAYTVGLTLWGLPELVVTGMRIPELHELLNAEARRLVDRGAPESGARLTLTSGRGAEVVPLPHPDAHLITAADMLGPRLRAIQLVWCDDRGRWPWDLGFRSRRGGQPVLGPRSGAAAR